MHLPPLIHDLALILAISGAASIIFKWLKQPIVLGYLIAGVFVGPHISIFPTVLDVENVKVWAEIGVIFLLFHLGLEFNFRKLLEIGRPAAISATCEVAIMTAVGFAAGRLLGWSSMDSIFLGGVLAISSTTIIVKAFEELGVKTQSFASLVFGILIVEDLFAVILLGLLSTIAVTQSLEGMTLVKQTTVLFAYLLIFIPIGLWITPRFFRLIHSHLSDESRVIISLGLCLSLALGSTYAGFSPALGAFLMGAFLGETNEGERVERFLKPIRDLFGAVFFTSVGMLVNPQHILSNIPLIVLISLITIVGKVLTTAGGALLAGQDKKTSFQAGLCLGQIGEFSFIIATLGLTLNVVREDLYPLAVSVALLTTFTTPYLIRFAVSSRFSAAGKSRRTRNAEPRIFDGHLVEFEIHPHFRHSGFSLQELKLRERFGVSLVALMRGDRKILAPSRSDLLMPFDRIIVLGTDAQLAALEKFLKSDRHGIGELEEFRFILEKIPIKEGYHFAGKNLRESGIREKVQGIILGIERKGEKILNPEATMTLKVEDVLWIYGRKDHLRSWIKELES